MWGSVLGWRAGEPSLSVMPCGVRVAGQAEARMARLVTQLSRIDLSWVRIEIALLTGALILAG